MTHRRLLTVLLALALVLVGADGGAVAATTFTKHDDREGTLRISGAPIRVGPNPYVHTNSSHAALNVSRIYVEADGDLVVNRTTQAGDRVVACIAEEDETLVALDIQVGCSGGGKTSVLRFYKDGKRLSARSRTIPTTANVWLQITSFIPAS